MLLPKCSSYSKTTFYRTNTNLRSWRARRCGSNQSWQLLNDDQATHHIAVKFCLQAAICINQLWRELWVTFKWFDGRDETKNQKFRPLNRVKKARVVRITKTSKTCRWVTTLGRSLFVASSRLHTHSFALAAAASGAHVLAVLRCKLWRSVARVDTFRTACLTTSEWYNFCTRWSIFFYLAIVICISSCVLIFFSQHELRDAITSRNAAARARRSQEFSRQDTWSTRWYISSTYWSIASQIVND